jgi:hypothetical protein
VVTAAMHPAGDLEGAACQGFADLAAIVGSHSPADTDTWFARGRG